MVTTTKTILVDDVDGGEADETVRLGLDHVQYEIDLSKQNAANLRKSVSEFIDHARKVGGRTRTTVSGQMDSAAVRAWAKSNGVQIKSRGRIPSEVITKFQEAGN
jgi:hypothetical protein